MDTFSNIVDMVSFQLLLSLFNKFLCFMCSCPFWYFFPLSRMTSFLIQFNYASSFCVGFAIVQNDIKCVVRCL